MDEEGKHRVHRTGRPRLPRSERLANHTIRLRSDTIAAAYRLAHESNLTLAEWMRRAIEGEVARVIRARQDGDDS